MKKSFFSLLVVTALTVTSCWYSSPQSAAKEFTDKYGTPTAVVEKIEDCSHTFELSWDSQDYDADMEAIHASMTISADEGSGCWVVSSYSEEMSRLLSPASFMDGGKK